MTWEQFDPVAVRAAAAPTDLVVTIYHDGEMILSGAAWHALGKPQRIHLLYDRSGRRIGVRAADANDTNAFRLGSLGPGTGVEARAKKRRFSARTFLAHHGLSGNYCKRVATLEGNTLVIDDMPTS